MVPAARATACRRGPRQIAADCIGLRLVGFLIASPHHGFAGDTAIQKALPRFVHLRGMPEAGTPAAFARRWDALTGVNRHLQ